MDEDKPEAKPVAPREKRGGGNMFVWGIVAGCLITALVFYKAVFGLLKDALGNVMPVFFTPGLLEISMGLIGFGIVIGVNYLLWRKEGEDEWVELPDEEE